MKTTHMAGEAQQPGAAGRALRGRLFERVMERIHRYFCKLIREREAVEDCLQETLILLERSLEDGTYDPTQSFNRWMWMKAHRVYVDHCRRHARRLEALEQAASEPGTAPSAARAVDARLDAGVLLEKLERQLDEEAFEAFVLHYDQDLTVTEIAGILERSRKTVRKRIEAGRRQALRILDENPDGEQ